MARTRPATSTVLVPGWRWIGEHDGALAVVPGGALVVLDAVVDVGDFVEVHRVAVAVRDDRRPVRRRAHQLPVGLDDERFVAVDRAGRQVDVGVRDGVLHLVDAHAARGERAGIDLYAHRVFLLAEHLDLRHAVDRRDALGEIGLGVFVDR